MQLTEDLLRRSWELSLYSVNVRATATMKVAWMLVSYSEGLYVRHWCAVLARVVQQLQLTQCG